MSNDIFTGKAAQLAEKAVQANPSNPPATKPRQRVPMALPTLKLEVPEIPGYVCRWLRGTNQRIQQALAAGYVFVERGEVEINHAGLANDYEQDGNSDLGTRVSVSAGSNDVGPESGGRLYLMKIRQEHWDEDEAAVGERHEQIASALRGDRGLPQSGQDTSNRYSRGENRNIFTPRRA